MAQQKPQSAVRIVNKAAHLKYLALGGDADTIAVPPTEDGAPGTIVRFDSQEERERFDRAIQTAGVQGWIDAGELEISDAQPASSEQSVAIKSPAEQVEQTDQTRRELQRAERDASARVAAEAAAQTQQRTAAADQSAPSRRRERGE